MESACRKWGARRFRKSLRDKGLGARGSLSLEGARARHREIGRKRCVADGMGIFYKNGTNF